MALVIKLRANETVTINGCRVQAAIKCTLYVLDRAEIVLPNGERKQGDEKGQAA